MTVRSFQFSEDAAVLRDRKVHLLVKRIYLETDLTMSHEWLMINLERLRVCGVRHCH